MVENENNCVLYKTLSGCCSSMCMTMCSYPLDTIKTHNQVKKLVNKKLLFKGLKYDLICDLLSSIVYYYVYENISKTKDTRNIITGAAIGATMSSLIKSPLDYLKTRTQLNLKTTLNLKHMFRNTPITLLKSVPTEIVTFTTMETMKEKLIKRRNKKNNYDSDEHIELRPHEMMLCGFLGGTLSVLINNPLDVTKNNSIVCNSLKKGFIFSKNNKLFYTGLKQRVLISGINASIGFSMYDTINNTLCK